MKRRVSIIRVYREFRQLRRKNPYYTEPGLGAAYGSKEYLVML
jgi:hypothetical protein